MKAIEKIRDFGRNKIKNRFNAKKKEIKQKIEDKIDSARDRFVVECILPYLNQYLRELIISKGLNPDIMPKPKMQEAPDANEICNRAKKRLYFDHYVPSWVSASFKDITKHPIFKGRKMPMPEVVETLPEGIDANILQNIIETPVMTVPEPEPTPIVEEKPKKKKAKKKVIDKTENKATKKSIKKKPVKLSDIMIEVDRAVEPVVVTKTFGNGAFRRIASK